MFIQQVQAIPALTNLEDAADVDMVVPIPVAEAAILHLARAHLEEIAFVNRAISTINQGIMIERLIHIIPAAPGGESPFASFTDLQAADNDLELENNLQGNDILDVKTDPDIQN